MIGFWLLLVSIPLYIIGSFLESLAYHMHGGRSGEYQMTVNQYDDVLLSDGRTVGALLRNLVSAISWSMWEIARRTGIPLLSRLTIFWRF